MLAAAVIYYAQDESGVNLLDRSIDISNAQNEINALHEEFRNNRVTWQTRVDNFEDLLNESQVAVEDIDGYTSQAYMSPASASFDAAAPSLIWGESSHTGGHWLRFTKGDVVLKYRFECGYQFPAEKYISAGGQVTPNPSPNPEPTPDNPVKDPSKDPVYQGNAQRGGGYNLSTDGTGDYQATRPTWQDSGSSSGGSSSSGGGSSSGGSSSSGGGSSGQIKGPVIDTQPDKSGSKSGGDQGAFS